MLTTGPVDPFVAARKTYLGAQARFLELLDAIQPPLTQEQRRAAAAWWYATFGDGR